MATHRQPEQKLLPEARPDPERSARHRDEARCLVVTLKLPGKYIFFDQPCRRKLCLTWT